MVYGLGLRERERACEGERERERTRVCVRERVCVLFDEGVGQEFGGRGAERGLYGSWFRV